MNVKAIEADSRPPSKLPKAVVRLGWVSFLTDVSSEMIFPLVPAFLKSLPGSPALALGFIEGVADATASFVKIVSGRAADRAKAKKPLVLLGYGLSSLARPLVAVAAVWPVVLVVRFLDRVGKGIRSAPRDALIANVAPPGRRGQAFGLHRAFDNAGAVLGPLVATAVLAVHGASYRTVFALAAVPAVLSLLVLAFGVRETPNVVAPSEPARDVDLAAPLPAPFWRAAFIVALFTLAASSDAFLLLKATESGVPPVWLPVLWSGVNAIRAALSTWGGGLSDRIGRRHLLVGAWLVYAACYASLAFVTSAIGVSVVLGVYALHAALSEGAERALVADLVPASARGRAFGWFHGLLGFSSLLASVLFGVLWKSFGMKVAFLAGAAPAILAAVALAIVTLPDRVE